jgi:hypothetical protein
VFRAEDEAEAALPVPPELNVPQALSCEWINFYPVFGVVGKDGAKQRAGTEWGRVITAAARWGQRQGWDAAMAAVKAQQQPPPSAEGAPLPAPSPAKPQPHGGAMIINGRIVPIFTPAPAPSAPAKLVQRLAALIAGCTSTARAGDGATPAAIQVVRHVADWAENRHGFHVPLDLRTEADRAAAELEGHANG